MTITQFSGRHRFLSNFWPAVVSFDGVEYPTVEHAYQAAKTLDENERDRIRWASTPGEAKRLGKKLEIRPGWSVVRIFLMTDLVRQKFGNHPPLAGMLLATGDQQLIERNSWGDEFWGVCRGRGQNNLGLILMKTRAELRLRREPLLPLEGET